ncbi:MAG: SCO family protein [Alphaproteobacteria bacterium]|nr:SCO family protein [Alphaproteobacteria bacterium]MBU0863480.1 SCO family protein [Alphaproteobacteria bacterium]MBU1823358.1 SCO family protein [Alphaproteobacteria bacterium]
MAGTDPKPTPVMVVVRRVLWLLVALAAVIGAVLALQSKPGGKQDSTTAYAGAGIGGPFTLTGSDGKTVTERSFAGKPFAIFFGFTRCPEVCPTTLARMASLREQLGEDGDKFEIVFVSVDPEHDKPADIGSYISLFKTPIHGLTGTATQLAAIQKAYGVYVKKVPLEGGDYTVDHTAAIYLMDRHGHFVTTIDYHENDKVALEKLKRIVA